MSDLATSTIAQAAPQVHIVRDFDAPRELVFLAWSSAAHLERWFAPEGCRITVHEYDFRPGGRIWTCIHTPDGHECWCVGAFREVATPERIVFTMIAADAQGKPVEPADVGMDPAWPRETTVTVTLDEVNGQTRLTLDQTVSEALARQTGAYPSWLSMFDRLATLLSER
ncbi:MAG: SRPBCC domain-containing protein [Pirellulales bacterium]|nr:SRPBCC domain-containing protein [Pirellulales bacterium]